MGGAQVKYTLEEVSRHRNRNDCWLAIDGLVLDVTHFLGKHPMGDDIILEHAGTDATAVFGRSIHSDTAYEMMLNYKIGTLAAQQEKPNEKASSSSVITSAYTTLIGLYEQATRSK
jgi:cytochrome b involved in lipid metabolism